MRAQRSFKRWYRWQALTGVFAGQLKGSVSSREQSDNCEFQSSLSHRKYAAGSYGSGREEDGDVTVMPALVKPLDALAVQAQNATNPRHAVSLAEIIALLVHRLIAHS